MMNAFDKTLAARIRAAANIAVLVLDDEDKAIPLAEALLAGGVTAMELTLRTPAALRAMERIADAFPQMILGAGTVLRTEQLQQARDAGAAFAVSPGLNPEIVEAAARIGLPFAPGVMTPSEIDRALALGCTLQKFFPAEPLGGLKTLKAIAAPFLHLGPSFIPLGGLKPENTKDYLASPLISACGGSWMCTPALIAASDWSAVQANAALATRLAKEARG
ncbi:MAG: bifunctional 4-hydroxy-2-oxoglutarate aldolase/2-dehydro-3-deoxy-phosphogluconate aldolase [Kiritimatiellia bacterium]|jgi:2-dehydro-3-deoxyphosphogluconate aldolase/(4S)-4-hydroxy-2-oxoglutarate aldolase